MTSTGVSSARSAFSAVTLRTVVALALFVAGASVNRAQVIVPPAASLDVQIPVAPIPVTVDGHQLLAYELHITNFRAVDLELTGVDVLANQDTAPLVSYREAALMNGLGRAGARPDRSDKRVIAGGARVIFFVWLPLDQPPPTTLRHRIAFDVKSATGAEPGVVEGGRVDVGRAMPVVLGPPLRGGPWIAIYDPTGVSGHRRALFAIDGKARIPARFAIDWVKVSTAGRMSEGDATVLSNWSGYAEEVLAVGDGVVADVEMSFAEPTRPIRLDNAAGNYVILDLGGNRFVSYEHLKPGSVRVRRGERVASGQVLALVGGSGSISSGPHLHFHVSDGPSPLGAEGIPWVFRRFERLGAYESMEALGSGAPWTPRPKEQDGITRLELPRQQTVLRFD